MKTEHEWVQTRVIIQNRQGLHARPVMSFVDIANGFTSDLRVGKTGDQEVDGKSIMQMMQLFAKQGTELTIRANGPDAADALHKLTELVDGKFDED